MRKVTRAWFAKQLPLPVDESVMPRFWKKVNKTSDCWLWTASKNWCGYGEFSYQRKLYRAHRFLYEVERGQVPSGMVLDHICRVRSCVRPDHLRILSHKENILIGNSPSVANKLRTACIRGHLFTPENLGKAKFRRCLACLRLDNKKYYQKQKDARQ